MTFNTCKTCGANNGRAGLLIDGECLNCSETRKTGTLIIHLELNRTDAELNRTAIILNDMAVVELIKKIEKLRNDYQTEWMKRHKVSIKQQFEHDEIIKKYDNAISVIGERKLS